MPLELIFIYFSSHMNFSMKKITSNQKKSGSQLFEHNNPLSFVDTGENNSNNSGSQARPQGAGVLAEEVHGCSLFRPVLEWDKTNRINNNVP
jgi:hypothetical protein